MALESRYIINKSTTSCNKKSVATNFHTVLAYESGLNGSQHNKDEEVKFSWNDIFYLVLFLSHQLLAPAEKKNKFISFRERSPDNHTQFQTKMSKIYWPAFRPKRLKKHIFGAAHTYIPDIEEYPPFAVKHVTLYVLCVTSLVFVWLFLSLRFVVEPLPGRFLM